MQRGPADEAVVDAARDGARTDAHPRRGVALRIHVEQQGLALGRGDAGREVDGGRGLPHAAFLVDDRDGAAPDGRLRGGA